MRRAVPTTSLAVAVHLALAGMLLTARPAKKPATEQIASVDGRDDLVEVGAPSREAVASGETIVPAPGGGAMLVAPRGRMESIAREAPHVDAVKPAAPPPPSVTEVAPPNVEVMPPAAIGLGSAPLFLPKKDAPVAAPPAAKAHASAETLRPITASIQEAARASTAAVNGRAVFVVKAEAKEGDASIVAVDLVDREGPGWDDARRLAFEKLRGKKMTVPAGTKVALLSIEVTSAVRVPDVELGRRGENDMPELVLPDLNGGEHRVVATRVLRETYL